METTQNSTRPTTEELLDLIDLYASARIAVVSAYMLAGPMSEGAREAEQASAMAQTAMMDAVYALELD